MYNSIYKNVVIPAENVSEGVDVYFHLGKKDIPRKDELMTRFDKESMGKIVDLFRPVVVSWFGNEEHLINWEREDVNCSRKLERVGMVVGGLGKESMPKAYPMQLYRGAECFGHVLKMEMRKGWKYRWVVKIRPDVAIGDQIRLESLDGDRVSINGHGSGATRDAYRWLNKAYRSKFKNYLKRGAMSDHMAFIPRKFAEVYFGAWKASFVFCEQYAEGSGRFARNPEFWLAYWLAKNEVKWDIWGWFWMLVREGGQAECKRVSLIRGRGLVSEVQGEKMKNEIRLQKERKMVGTFVERCKRFNETGVLT